MSKIVDNFCLEEVIGHGQFSLVYRAKHLQSAEVVAIKVIKVQQFKEKPKLQECTVNEISILKKIKNNANVVKFLELLRTSNNYYFVYEYCNGGTLSNQITQQHHFSEAKSLEILAQLLVAFKSLLQFKIMHRDVKPSNILFHNGVVKLADFGFCKPLQFEQQMVQTMLGSPIYMAPEVLKGLPYSMKADLWSLGIVLHEMLFGFCPFEEKSIAKLIALHEQSELVIRRDINAISGTMEELLKRVLAKDPEERISWEQLFAGY